MRTHLEDRSPLETSLLRVLGCAFVALALVTAIGCGGRDDGPAEQAGEALEEAGDEAEDALDD